MSTAFAPNSRPQGFAASSRLDRLAVRSHDLSKGNRRNVYVDNREFLVYHWSGKSSAFSPATGEQALGDDERINLGDHNCRVDVGVPYPYVAEMPSKRDGLELTAANWAKDYAFFLDHSPAEVYPDETIVGEFHWQLDEARFYKFPDEVYGLGFALRDLGAGGISLAHTCPDLGIGLTLGWGGLLEKVRENRARFEGYGAADRVEYLDASEQVVLAIIRYVGRHADRAAELAAAETDPDQKRLYEKVAANCAAIATGAPATFEQAVQWIQLFQVVERINGHGNGYGRLDQLLIDFYRRDTAAGVLTREDARSLIAELFLKYGGNYFSFAGRNRELKDATNEVSWVGLEAYDMIGGYNHIGVMWHPEIDPAYYAYACDVVSRHGCGVPTLINYDVLRASELYSGYSEEDAWNVSYSGCQWYCAVGNEYSDHDLNCLVLVKPMQRAIDIAIRDGIQNFESFWRAYTEEVEKTAVALVAFKNKVYEWHPKVWPEMVTSLCMHGPIEHGRDVTDSPSVNNAFTSVNVLGVPNVVDSMFAIKKVVFEDRRFTLAQLREAMDVNWQGQEVMRQVMLNQEKFGNDLDGVDAMYVRVADQVLDTLEHKRNIKGFTFRPSLFQYMGHTYAGPMMGATPDGRRAEEPLAHGCNPMHGRNTAGITATANSLMKVDFSRFQGGSLQIELQPRFFDGKDNIGSFIEKFSRTYMAHGGVQINLNVIDLAQLQDAIVHPDKPEYQDIVVKVTGYSAHFVLLDREFQKEFVSRVNYAEV
jgi:pyruvate-formate lyase